MKNIKFRFQRPLFFGRFWFIPAHSIWYRGYRTDHVLTGAFWCLSWEEK